MADKIVKVLVDTREQKVGKQAIEFFKKQKIMTQSNTNKDGDLLFVTESGATIYIERKSITDFAGSYISGHLQDQAVRLSDKKYRACIIHGQVKELKSVPVLKRLNESSIDKMIINMMLIYRLPTFWVDTPIQYFKKSLLIAQTVAKNQGKTLDSIKLNARVKDRPDVNILRAGEDIGLKTATLLLNEFETPKNVLNASRDDLLAIKGVGDSTISKIKELKRVYEEGVK